MVLLAAVAVASQPQHCSARGDLPDPKCTPGSVNRSVNQGNIGSTICVKGWTATIRPSAAYTGKLKRQQMQQYGYTDSPTQHEEDHLIPLELGGSPSDPKNLWPEPSASPNKKDAVENAARAAVCRGALPLHDAQTEMARNWVNLGKKLGVR